MSDEMTGFSGFDGFDAGVLFFAIPAVIVWSHIHNTIAALSLFSVYVVVVAAIIWRRRASRRVPGISTVKGPTHPLLKLVGYSQMSVAEWDSQYSHLELDDALNRLRTLYRNSSWCHFTVNGWIEHVDHGGKVRQEDFSLVNLESSYVYLYWYECADDVNRNGSSGDKYQIADVSETISDDARWARLFKDNPHAFWLDPHYWGIDDVSEESEMFLSDPIVSQMMRQYSLQSVCWHDSYYPVTVCFRSSDNTMYEAIKSSEDEPFRIFGHSTHQPTADDVLRTTSSRRKGVLRSFYS